MICVIYCVWALPLRIQTHPHPHLVQPLNPAKQNRLSERRFCRDSEEIYDETRYFVHEGIRDVKDFNFVPLPRVTLRQSITRAVVKFPSKHPLVSQVNMQLQHYAHPI